MSFKINEYTNKNKSIYFHHTSEDKTSCQTIGPESHDAYEFYYLVKGKVTHFIEGETYNTEPGDAIFINQQELHKLNIDASTGYDRYCVRFTKSFLPTYQNDIGELLEKLFYDNNKQRIIKSNILDTYNIKLSFENIDKLCRQKNKDKYFNAILLSELILLLVNICKAYEKNIKSFPAVFDINSTTKTVVNYINDNIAKNITIDDISKQVFLSKNYLSHIFKRFMGISLKRYILVKRMNYAKEQLKQGVPANEISKQFGYEHYSSFYNSYVKIIKESPSSIRK